MSESLITASRVKGNTLIQLGTSLDVAKAVELKKELTKVFKRKPPYLLDGAAVERIDTASLQVLVAFTMEALSRGVEIQWDGASSALKSSAKLLGLGSNLRLPD